MFLGPLNVAPSTVGKLGNDLLVVIDWVEANLLLQEVLLEPVDPYRDVLVPVDRLHVAVEQHLVLLRQPLDHPLDHVALVDPLLEEELKQLSKLTDLNVRINQLVRHLLKARIAAQSGDQAQTLRWQLFL